MAVLLESADDGSVERVVVAVGEGMAAHDLDLHPPTTNSRRLCSAEPVDGFG
jgi:hypothetical protein